jgi:hypothetical protein
MSMQQPHVQNLRNASSSCCVVSVSIRQQPHTSTDNVHLPESALSALIMCHAGLSFTPLQLPTVSRSTSSR